MGGIALFDGGKMASLTHTSNQAAFSAEMEPPLEGGLPGSMWTEMVRARSLHPGATVVMGLPEELFNRLDSAGPESEDTLRAAALLGVELIAGGSLAMINRMAAVMAGADPWAKGWEG